MSTDHRATRDPIEPYSPRASDDLPLFHFGMRQLLTFVSLVSLLMAAMAISGGLTAFVLLLATLVVSFHLFSTALGTQLRFQANRTLRQRGAMADPDPRPADALRPVPQSQSRSPWHERRSTPLPWLMRLVVIAWLIGAIGGALLLVGMLGHRPSLGGMAVGSFSLGVVAAWFAFVGYSFYGVFRHGLRDAMTNDTGEHRPFDQRD